MIDIYKEIVRNREQGRLFVIATIVRTAGSSPRQTGAKMIVFLDGTICGTIGGGLFEKQVIDDCLSLMSSGNRFLLKKYSFAKNGPDATGMQCGGEAEVYMEVNTRPNKLIIFGAGHVGSELASLAKRFDFSITVADNRRELLDDVSKGTNVILIDEHYSNNLPDIDDSSYVVIVTSSHEGDLAVLKNVLKQNSAYLGMIGSKAKIKKVFTQLEQNGFTKGQISKIHSPIGLDIGAEGPAEIALAIMAEIIMVKNSLLVKSYDRRD
ncbi:MAG: XdhC/CoxI family protein [Candidatus Zixiibacteriota bacterium]